MTITQKLFDSILRKNGRAQKRMSRRLMKKAYASNCHEIGVCAAQVKRYTPLEMELANRYSRSWSAKSKRKHAKRLKDIDKSVMVKMREQAGPKLRHLFPIILLMLFSARAFCLCPTGSTILTSIGAGGNASVAATWGGTPIGDGNGKCLVATGPVVIDTNLGTNGGAGLKGAYTQGSGSFTFSTAAARSIYFGSTGSDPCGSGTTAAPGTDATMFGFFLPVGANRIVGTQANPITITSADGVSPWYIAKTDAVGTPSITVQWLDAYHLGASAACGGIFSMFQGIGVYDDNGGALTLDIQNSRFSGHYRAAFAYGNVTTANVSLTVNNNLFTGRTGPSSIGSQYPLGTTIVQNNTETAPAAVGFIESYGTTPGTYTGSGNAGAGTASIALGGVLFGSIKANTTISGDLIYNDATQAGSTSANVVDVTIPTATNGTLATGIYGENCNQCIVCRVQQPYTSQTCRMTGNAAISNHRSVSGQGMYYGQAGVITIDHNLAVQTDAPISGNATCMDVYDPVNPGDATEIVYNNTCASLAPIAGAIIGIQVADSGPSQMPNNSIHNNLVSGFDYSYKDTGTATNTYVNTGTAGVGVWANASYSSLASPHPYAVDGTPTRWDNGVTAHPSATYGDLNGVDPAFLDTTRAIAAYDLRVLGGPGTAADMITRLGYRSGWGGTYTLGSTPVADLITWVTTGFTPGDSRICPAGVPYGLMPCVTAATGIIPQ